jgi:F-type H+-transporting ATPase subunit b
MAEFFHEVFDPTGPEFWVLVATIIFLAIAWKVGGFGQLTAALDRRAGRIQSELDEARQLRQEAERLLADYKNRAHEAEAEAEAIIATAKSEAERFKTESVAKVKDFVARRTKMAEGKIAQAEAQAVADVRSAAAEAAIKAASLVLTAQMAGAKADSIMKSAIDEVKARLN